MAEISDPEIAAFNNALNEITKKFGGLDLATEALRLKTKARVTDEKELNESYKRIMRERQREEREIVKQNREGRITYQEAKIQMEELNNRVREVIPDDFRKTFENTVALEGSKNDLTMRYSNLLKGLSLTTQALSTTFAHSFKLMGSLAPSVDPLSAALDTARDTVAMFGAALKFVGDHSLALGLAASSLGPEVGLAVAALSSMTGALGDATNFLANNVMPVFNTYVKSLSTGFKEAAQAGGLFVGGLTELQNTALSAGVNTETFGKLLREQSANLQLFGGDVVNGGRRVAQVTQQLAKNLGPNYQQMFVQMGYSVQEIPGIIAQVGADVSRTIGGATNEQVAKAVQDYAKNLRVIADLTGQDAKTLQEKAANEFKDLRYRQFLSDLQERFGPLYRKQFEMQAAALPEAELKLLKEKIAGQGNIYSQAGGIIASQIPAFDASTDAAYAMAINGQMTATSMLDVSQANSKAAAAQMQSVKDFAAAGVITGQFAESLTAIQNSYDRVIANANQTASEYEAKRNALLAATETNDVKIKELAETEIAGMRNKIEAEKAATIALGDYLKGITKINELNLMLIRSTGALIKFIDDNLPGGRQVTDREVQAENDRLARRLSQSSARAITSQIEGALSDSQRTLMQNNPNLPNPVTNREAFLRSAAAQGDEESRAELLMMGIDLSQGQALGGILSGPKTGYLAKLHGTEAVLPENLTSLLTEAANSAQTVKEQLPTAINTRSASEDLLASLNSKFDDMISLLDDISSHTERTSVRVA